VPADRRELARLAAPVAFLVAITILIVLVHSALSSGGKTTTAAATTAKQTTTKAKPKQKPTTASATTAATTSTTATSTGPAQYYTIQSGDTLAAVAAREGTTVQELVTLNPGVNPNALHIGQQIRIK
jgi:LysM repeat protein